MITTLKHYTTLTEAIKAHTPAKNPDQAGTKIIRHLAEKNPGAEYAVLFVNQDLSSSKFGSWTVMVVGKDQTYKTLAEVESTHLFDLPSQRQYPIAYVELGGPK